MKPSLYLETSVVSYLTSRRSRDLITAARQQLTVDWWESQRNEFDIFISPLVRDEAELGDAEAAAARMAALDGLDVFTPGEDAEKLTQSLLKEVPLPKRAEADAAHIAIASAAGADFLLTWNFKHIANPVLRERIAVVCRRRGFRQPVLCTPEELVEGRRHDPEEY